MSQPPRPRLYLRERREALGLSQDDVAERTGYSKTYVHHLETHERRWNGDHLALFAKALECEPADLFVPPGAEDGIESAWHDVPVQHRAQVIAMIRSFVSSLGAAEKRSDDFEPDRPRPKVRRKRR